MAKSKHRTTKRGTQAQRARMHWEWLKENHYRVWAAIYGAQYFNAAKV